MMQIRQTRKCEKDNDDDADDVDDDDDNKDNDGVEARKLDRRKPLIPLKFLLNTPMIRSLATILSKALAVKQES